MVQREANREANVGDLDEKNIPGRRRVLALLGAAVAAPFVPGCSGGGSSNGTSGDGGPSCDPMGMCMQGQNTLVVDLAMVPSLAKVGGSASIVAPGYKDPICGDAVVLVFQPSQGKFLAVSGSCSHQCCQVTFDAPNNQIHCPCHGATYAFDGTVTHGPALVNLAALSVCTDGCKVFVQLK